MVRIAIQAACISSTLSVLTKAHAREVLVAVGLPVNDADGVVVLAALAVGEPLPLVCACTLARKVPRMFPRGKYSQTRYLH